MSDDFDLLETNSNQKTEKVDVNWGKAIDTMKSKLAQEEDPQGRQKILNATLDDEIVISFIFLAISLISSLIVIITSGYKLPRWYGYYLLTLYGTYMLISILVVTHTLPQWIPEPVPVDCPKLL